MEPSVTETPMTRDECSTLYKALTNKDHLPKSCQEFIYDKNSVGENHSLNVMGGYRPRNGVSHAVLQRRMTGKMSGHTV